MKKTTILCSAALLLAFASCSESGRKSAADFASAVGLKDTVKINSVLQPRQAVWDSIAFAAINADSLTIEEVSQKQYKATVNDSAYFVFTEQDGDGNSDVKEVTPMGNGWYQVDFIGCGSRAKRQIKVIKQGDKILFDDYK